MKIIEIQNRPCVLCPAEQERTTLQECEACVHYKGREGLGVKCILDEVTKH